MKIPAENVAITDLSKAASASLVLCLGYNPTLFWVVGGHAVFLSSDYAGHAFDAGTAENWHGVAIGPVDVRVDPSSANKEPAEGRWNLRAAKGELSVQVTTKLRGYNETSWLKLAEIPTTDAQTVYFSNWAIGQPRSEGDHWDELVTFDNGNVATNLAE